MSLEQAFEVVVVIVEAGGVATIILGIAVSSVSFAAQLRSGAELAEAYQAYRRGLGRAILLGLELLIAADIVRTVVVSPTLTDLGILAGIVLIRTFLSMTLELEIEGRWPWQGAEARPVTSAARSAGESPPEEGPSTGRR